MQLQKGEKAVLGYVELTLDSGAVAAVSYFETGDESPLNFKAVTINQYDKESRDLGDRTPFRVDESVVLILDSKGNVCRVWKLGPNDEAKIDQVLSAALLENPAEGFQPEQDAEKSIIDLISWERPRTFARRHSMPQVLPRDPNSGGAFVGHCGDQIRKQRYLHPDVEVKDFVDGDCVAITPDSIVENGKRRYTVNLEQLKPGDLILIEAIDASKKIRNRCRWVQLGQFYAKPRHDWAHARWFHAAMYLGSGILVEVNAKTDLKFFTKYAGEIDTNRIRVRRPTDENLGPKIAEASRQLRHVLYDDWAFWGQAGVALMEALKDARDTKGSAELPSKLTCSAFYAEAYRLANNETPLKVCQDLGPDWQKKIVPACLSESEELEDVALSWVEAGTKGALV